MLNEVLNIGKNLCISSYYYFFISKSTSDIKHDAACYKGVHFSQLTHKRYKRFNIIKGKKVYCIIKILIMVDAL